MRKVLTLAIIQKNEEILLGTKKRGFGEGKLVGFGGKVDLGESIEEAALREMKEEAEIKATNLNKIGILEFRFKEDYEILEVHIFKATEFLGEPKETEEMSPEWINVNNIPFERMWADDIYWFPLFLENKKFKGKFLFADFNNIISKELVEVKEI